MLSCRRAMIDNVLGVAGMSLFLMHSFYIAMKMGANHKPHLHVALKPLTENKLNPIFFFDNTIILPYSCVIRRISHISAYSLISAYVFAATNIHC